MEIETCVEEMHQLIQLQHRRTSYHLDFLATRCARNMPIWTTENRDPLRGRSILSIKLRIYF